MNTSAMLNLHHDTTPWAWALHSHAATTLAAAPALRWLRVDAGCVWVTAREAACNGSGAAADIWLHAGQSLALPAGSQWVLEAWPQARLSLLMAAPGGVSRERVSSGLWQRLRRWVSPRQWLVRAARAAAC